MEPYDFTQPKPIDELAARALVELLTRAIGRSALVLAAQLRRPVNGLCGGLAEADPNVLFAPERMWLAVGQADEAAVIAADRGTITGLAEVFMGAPAAMANRAPTKLELNILIPRLADVLDSLRGVLAGGVTPDSGPTLAFIDPEPFRQRADLLVAPLTVRIGETDFELPLVVPRGVLEGEDRNAGPHVTIEQAVANVPIELEVVFDPFRVTAGDLDELEVGAVLRMDHRRANPLHGLAGGRELLRVIPADPGRHLTVEVTEVLQGELAS